MSSRRISRPMGRTESSFRDDRLFVLATDDTNAPKQYFEFLKISRVRVLVLETSDCKSAPMHVLDRLKAWRKNQQLEDDDECWLLLDEDHNFDREHARDSSRALHDACTAGFRLALSSPCFDVWLLLHHVELGAETINCADVAKLIREAAGEFNKCKLKREHYPRESIEKAIERARKLDVSPQARVPTCPGSRVYQILAEILGPGSS